MSILWILIQWVRYFHLPECIKVQLESTTVRKTDTSGGFKSFREILKTFIQVEKFEPMVLIPTNTPILTYTTAASVADREHHLRQTPEKRAPEHPPHLQFRYQSFMVRRGWPYSKWTHLRRSSRTLVEQYLVRTRSIRSEDTHMLWTQGYIAYTTRADTQGQ